MGNRIYTAPDGTKVALDAVSPELRAILNPPVTDPIAQSFMTPVPAAPQAIPVSVPPVQNQYQTPVTPDAFSAPVPAPMPHTPAPITPVPQTPLQSPGMQATSLIKTTQLPPQAQTQAQGYMNKYNKIQADIAAGKKDIIKGSEESQKILDEVKNNPMLTPSPEQIAAEQKEIQAQKEAIQAQKDRATAATQNVKDFKYTNWWADRTNGEKALAALAIIAGSLGQGLRGGGENYGMKAINDSIERDVALQRDRFGQLKETESRERDAYTQAMNMFKDSNAAAALAKAQAWENVKNRLQITRDQTSDKTKLLAIDQALAEMEQKKLENLNTVYGKIETSTELQQKQMKPTPGQEELDKNYAKDYNEWTGSGVASYAKNVTLLEDAKKKIMTAISENRSTSGRVKGRLPDFATPEENIKIRQQVQQAAQGALRATLGSQFTEKEGERIMQNAYDERLSPEANLEKIQLAINEIKRGAANQMAKARYFQRNGSLIGYKYETPEDMNLEKKDERENKYKQAATGK